MSERKFYLTTGPNPKGSGLLAVVTLGHPQRGDEEVTVCTVEIVPNMKAKKSVDFNGYWQRHIKG